jgi:menaquinol-cytochrome c reductase iron-sulfur subunit
MDRRKLLDLLLKGGGAVIAGALAVPAALVALAPALGSRSAPRWCRLGKVPDYPVGEVTESQYEVPREDWSGALRTQTVYVWRPAENEIIVFSRNCTDLSCPVNWDSGSQCFFCPCHGGIFARDGAPMAGPPAEPLFRYANRVRGEQLEIDARSVPPMA